MRSKDPALMEKIRVFVDRYYRERHAAPSTQAVGDAVGVTKQTACRYLLEMDERGMLEYRGGIRSSPQMAKCRTGYISVPVVGSIRCGDPETETEEVEEYVSLPESIFGRGSFYLVRAKGDSMTDAGIEEGDLVLIELSREAKVGDIVVALGPEGENTLKRYAGQAADGYRLAYMNEAKYPGKFITVRSFAVQGVARHVIKTLCSRPLRTVRSNG